MCKFSNIFHKTGVTLTERQFDASNQPLILKIRHVIRQLWGISALSTDLLNRVSIDSAEKFAINYDLNRKS